MKIIFTVLFVLASIATAFSQQPMNHNSVVEINEHDVQYKSNRILLKLYDQFAHINLSAEGSGTSFTGIPAISQLNIQFRVTSIKRLFPFAKKTNLQPNDLTTVYVIEYEHELVPIEVSRLFQEIEQVEFAEPDYEASMLVNPNDPYYQDGSQWYHSQVKAPAAWQLTTGDASQIIAIIDTGIDWTHPDLAENIWINQSEQSGNEGADDDDNGFVDDIRGWDFVNNDNNPMDDNSHGTHVAGIAGARTNNNVGIAGIAWNVKLMPLKVLQSSGRGNWSTIAQGVVYAAENGATIINMSLGGYTESLTMKTALENAYNKSVLVSAAGNDGLCIGAGECIGAPMFPAVYPWVLGVQASASNGGKTSWSNYDPTGPTAFSNPYGYNYEILAPGQNIYSTIPGNKYRYLSGTSMATPVVAGGVALIKSHLPNISTEELFARIIQASGSGVMDIEKAMTIQLVPDIRLESFTIVDTLAGCDRDGRADAGETVLINIKLKNYGGWAQNVKAELKLGEFEDKSVTVFTDSISIFQNLSSYAQVNNNDNPFKITIPENIANNRDIVLTVKTMADNWDSTNSKNQTIIIENGIEFSGVYEGKITLTANKNYLINGPFVCDTLIIEPGTKLNIGDKIYVNYKLEAYGKPDSMIVIDSYKTSKWYFITSKFYENLSGRHKYSYIKFQRMDSEPNVHKIFCPISNSIFIDSYTISADPVRFDLVSIKNSIITQCILNGSIINIDYHNTCVINNPKKYDYLPLTFFRPNTAKYNYRVFNNSIFGNYDNYGSQQNQIGLTSTNWGTYLIPANYLGTKNNSILDNLIRDFFDEGQNSVADKSLLTEQPSIEAHGHIWQVLTNDVNPYDEQFDPVGSESVKFDVYFNRAMDTNFTPFLTFGVREPYTQRVVIDSARWISWKQDMNIGDTYYHLQVSDKSDFSNLIIDKNDILDLNYKYDLNGNNQYFWKVRYKNGVNGDWYEWSEVKSFKTKQTQKAKVPNIIYPVRNDTLVNNAFFLLLEEDIFVQRFYFEVATDENFSNIINSDSITINMKYLQNLVADQTYYLRAKSINTNGISDFSSIVQFKVRCTNNYAAPNLITPINNDTTYNITYRIFKWNSVPWAVKYQFQIATNTAFTTLNHESFITDTIVKFFENLPLGIKYWRVKAINGNIESPWSQIFKFTLPTKTVNISLDSVFTYNLITYNGSGLDSTEISILPDGTYYWRFGTENQFNTFDIINKKVQTNIPIDNAKWMDTNVTFRWNNGPKANTVYNARWQAYHTMDFTTGDGLQMIRVAGAKDNEGFEIPIEWNRFEFEVQATATLSSNFFADGKVGKIDLEWGMPDAERDILGFNLYRFVKKGTDKWGDTVRVNNILIVDSAFSDVNVIPDSTYYYVYRLVRTTLDEGDDSRMVAASAYPTVLDPPSLLYPPNDTTKMPVNFTFDWDEPSGATSYILQISRDNQFNDIVIDTEIDPSEYQISGLSNRTTYYWRVKAEGIQGVSNWSQVRNLRTIPVLPAVPTLVFPENNSVSMPLAMTFDWNNANEADNYQLQIADDEYFGNLLHDISGITSSQRNISNLAIDKIYFWRVRSKNEAGFSNWSAKWKFTTDTSGAANVPTSWTFKSNTGNSSTIVVPKTINPKIGGRDILPGDAVGLFYSDNGQYKSAGYGIWENKNLAITVWGDDEQTPAKDGFNVNEQYKLKLWDSRAEKEYFAVVTYSSGNSYYTVNGYSVLGELESAITIEHILFLSQGWNLISTYVEPENKNMLPIWSGIKDNVVIVKNNQGATYIPAFDINDIGNWDIYQGYQAYLTQAKTLSILGVQIKPEETAIDLLMGWNISSYLRNSSIDVELALKTLTDENALIIAKNNAGEVYIPEYDINGIGNMQPGQGYQMYLSKNSSLTYPANGQGKRAMAGEPQKRNPRIFIPDYRYTGNNSTLLVLADAPNGNEVGIYSKDEKLIGSGIFLDGKAAVTIWGDNPQTSVTDGAKDNYELRIKNYDVKTGRVSEVELTELVDGISGTTKSELTYKQDAFLLAKAKVEDSGDDVFNFTTSPNPFTDEVNIEFNIPMQSDVSLQVFSLNGNLVSTLVEGSINIGTHKYSLSGTNLANGEFTVILTIGNERFIRKVVRMR
jgi:hypothetical protein